jgi:hypothetical protein
LRLCRSEPFAFSRLIVFPLAAVLEGMLRSPCIAQETLGHFTRADGGKSIGDFFNGEFVRVEFFDGPNSISGDRATARKWNNTKMRNRVAWSRAVPFALESHAGFCPELTVRAVALRLPSDEYVLETSPCTYPTDSLTAKLPWPAL